MSFYCGVCKVVSPSGMSAARVVLERRVRTYDLGGGESVEGWEVVREVLAHGACALSVETGAKEADEAARKAAQGGVTIKDLLEGVRAVEDYSAHPDAAPPLDDVPVEEQILEFTPEPVPAQKIEEVFGKPKKKQKRAKKVKGEETN